MSEFIEALEAAACAAAVVLLLCAIGAWSLFFADFSGSDRPLCRAGSVAALFTDCEVIQ